MNSFISTQINDRYFQALDTVINLGLIRGIQTFTNEHNIDRRNFLSTKKESSTRQIRLDWIYYLVNDFNVSAGWIITGKGGMFK